MFRLSIFQFVATLASRQFVLYLLLSASLLASTRTTHSDYVVTQWGTDDGLPESTVTSAIKTQDGYLWVGTFNGLARFDGAKFTVFNPTNTPAIPHLGVLRLRLDSEAGLWINTLRGLARFHNRQWTAYPQVEKNAGHISECSVGTNLAVFQGPGLYRLERTKLSPMPLPDLVPSLQAPVPLCGSDGSLFLVNGPRVFRWIGEQWQRIALPVPVEEVLKSATQVKVSRDGTWLVATPTGLAKISNQKVLWSVALDSPEVYSLEEEPDGTVWMASIGNGLHKVSPKGVVSHFNKANGFPSNNLRFVYRDAEGNIWVGANGDGLVRMSKRIVTSYGVESGLPDFSMKSVAVDDHDAVLVATYGKSVYKLVNGKATPAFTGKDLPPHTQALLFDRSKRLWVGSYGRGLWRSKGTTLEKVPDTGSSSWVTIEALFEDSKGRIWIGNSQHAAVFDGDHFTDIPIEGGKSPVPIAAFAESPGTGTMWAVGDGGLYRLQEQKFVSQLRPDGKPFGALRAIRPEGAQGLLLGSLTEGLYRLHPTTGLQQLFPRRIPPAIGDLRFEGSTLFLATTQGIWTLQMGESTKDTSDDIWRGFGAAEGMFSYECSVGHQPLFSKDSQGGLWVATLKGVARIHPGQLPKTDFHPRPILEQVSYRVGDSPEVVLNVDGRSRLSLPADSWNIQVVFSAPSLSSPEKVDFRYTLNNASAGELAAVTDSSRELRMLRLPSGDNQLILNARVDGGEWSEHPATLILEREPHPWEDPAAILIALLLGLILLGTAAFFILRARTERHEKELLRSKAAEESMLLAKQKAEEASRLKTMFLANMSHELRTPMNGILGMTQLLQLTRLDEEQFDMLQTLHASGESLLRLLNEILDLSRIEAGRLELNCSPMNLRDAVRDAVELVQPLAIQKRLLLTWEIDPTTPTELNADSLRLRQILLNFLGNAIKFTDAGHISVKVENLGITDGLVQLRFVVTDTGCGIPADRLSDVFDVFTQVDSSSTRRHSGSGLGLTIAKRLANIMGGDVGATSTLGKGSSFWATVILEVSAMAKPKPAAAKDPVRFAYQPKVLVAEDNPVNQVVMKNLLTKLGCDVRLVNDGEQAIEMWKSRTFDLIFMDVQMPGLDGHETSKRIRELHAGAHSTPIIAVSASVLNEDRQRCTASGMDDFIPKPVSISDLVAVLTKYIPEATPKK